ncbi:MAG: hypothetical protein OEZ02_13320 [Anaerolineae bacterium]|nr:hypothetical protein [Anaerolineae bacterium]
MEDPQEDFSEENLANMVANPVFAGIGPFPRAVEDSRWIEDAATMIEEEGGPAFVARVCKVLTGLDLVIPDAFPETGEPQELAAEILRLCRQANPE